MTLREIDGLRRSAVGAAAARHARPARGRVRARWPATRSAIRRRARCGSTAAPGVGDDPVPHRLRDPGLPRPGRHRGPTASPFELDDARAGRRDVRGRRLPAGARRVRRRVDELRRLAVPQLVEHRAATSTTCATRSCRSSTSATRRSRAREHRGLTGKSSGGYGAMVVPMLRPDVFGALASHAGDALFECSLPAELPAARAQAARRLRRLARTRSGPSCRRCRPARHGAVRELRPDRLRGGLLARPGAAGQGAAAVRRRDRAADRRRVGAVAARRTRCGWRRATPTRCARCGTSTSTPASATSGSSTSARRRSAAELDKLGVEHTLELFDGKHGGITYRYPGAIRELVLALR